MRMRMKVKGHALCGCAADALARASESMRECSLSELMVSKLLLVKATMSQTSCLIVWVLGGCWLLLASCSVRCVCVLL